MKKWLMYIAIVVAGYGIKTALEPERDAAGAIVEAGSLDAFSIKVGDCFDDTSTDYSQEVEVTSVPAVPCSAPHDNEVYAVFDVPMPSYPGPEAMSEAAYNACLDRFEAFVGKDYASSSLDINPMYPTAESWAQNDHEVICAVYDVDLKKLTGTMKGRAI